jgi:hypothetical protein
MSQSLPAAISSAANGMKNAVTVHCSSAVEALNWAWIVGIATTTAAVGNWTIPAAATVAERVSPLLAAGSPVASTGERS